MDIVTMVLRTVFVYFFILVIMRIMGKREIGKLSIFDLVVSIMIAELAVVTIENNDMPLFMGLLPIIVLFITQILISYISLKSQKVRDIVDGKPSVLIEHGKIKEKEMEKQRYNLDDLLMQLRENNIHSVSQVEFAILEPSGKLSVFPKDKELQVTKQDLNLKARRIEFPTILIKDGVILEDNLESIGKNKFWLKREIKKRTGSTSVKNILFCTVNQDNHWYIDMKDD